jgi:hypothetical protein
VLQSTPDFLLAVMAPPFQLSSSTRGTALRKAFSRAAINENGGFLENNMGLYLEKSPVRLTFLKKEVRGREKVFSAAGSPLPGGLL